MLLQLKSCDLCSSAKRHHNLRTNSIFRRGYVVNRSATLERKTKPKPAKPVAFLEDLEDPVRRPQKPVPAPEKSAKPLKSGSASQRKAQRGLPAVAKPKPAEPDAFKHIKDVVRRSQKFVPAPKKSAKPLETGSASQKRAQRGLSADASTSGRRQATPVAAPSSGGLKHKNYRESDLTEISIEEELKSIGKGIDDQAATLERQARAEEQVRLASLHV